MSEKALSTTTTAQPRNLPVFFFTTKRRIYLGKGLNSFFSPFQNKMNDQNATFSITVTSPTD